MRTCLLFDAYAHTCVIAPGTNIPPGWYGNERRNHRRRTTVQFCCAGAAAAAELTRLCFIPKSRSMVWSALLLPRSRHKRTAHTCVSALGQAIPWSAAGHRHLIQVSQLRGGTHCIRCRSPFGQRTILCAGYAACRIVPGASGWSESSWKKLLYILFIKIVIS